MLCNRQTAVGLLGALGLALIIGACSETGDAPIGDPCTHKEQCASGYCLLEAQYGEKTGWSEGYCSDFCDNTCDDDAVCVVFDSDSLCLTNCESDGDCREDYMCESVTHSCLPDCRNGFDCGADLVCDDQTGFCL